MSMLAPVSAIFFAILAAAVTVFQTALVIGAPLGEFTLGGKYRGSLPPAIRLMPALSAVLLCGFAVVVVARAGIAFPELSGSSRVLTWLVVAYCAVGVVANFFTPSKRERAIWLPVVLLMLITSLIVAIG